MAFYIEHRHRAAAGKAVSTQMSPWEKAAEELLNGLLCHYEPPPNRLLTHEAEREEFHDPIALQRPPSILKTSSSFDSSKKHKKKGRMVRFSGVNIKQVHNNKQGHRPKFLPRFGRRKVNI